MILGDHGYLNPNEVILPQTPYFKFLGSDEQVEAVELKIKSDFPYAVASFSYQHNHVEVDKISELLNKGDNFTFGLVHIRAKITTAYQNVYTLFTIVGTKDLNYDYFALGHIHLRQTLSDKPPIVYSGNLQGRHINRQGVKGAYVGTVDESTGKINLDFVEVVPVIQQMATSNLDQVTSQTVPIKQVVEVLTKKNKYQTLFSLTVQGAQCLSEQELELVDDSDYWF